VGADADADAMTNRHVDEGWGAGRMGGKEVAFYCVDGGEE